MSPNKPMGAKRIWPMARVKLVIQLSKMSNKYEIGNIQYGQHCAFLSLIQSHPILSSDLTLQIILEENQWQETRRWSVALQREYYGTGNI